ncbi:744_t:CDS:2 [Acaulospora morrowiae]|uniref:744_t:CDS:1 n=1 Tax=Acaulospora morrowiae TaxID=94023 RepID=A0A9N9CRU8_9GLOM|nr:744_t:CDS:2 [Acaulospora morrowiae]
MSDVLALFKQITNEDFSTGATSELRQILDSVGHFSFTDDDTVDLGDVLKTCLDFVGRDVSCFPTIHKYINKDPRIARLLSRFLMIVNKQEGKTVKQTKQSERNYNTDLRNSSHLTSNSPASQEVIIIDSDDDNGRNVSAVKQGKNGSNNNSRRPNLGNSVSQVRGISQNDKRSKVTEQMDIDKYGGTQQIDQSNSANGIDLININYGSSSKVSNREYRIVNLVREMSNVSIKSTSADRTVDIPEGKIDDYQNKTDNKRSKITVSGVEGDRMYIPVTELHRDETSMQIDKVLPSSDQLYSQRKVEKQINVGNIVIQYYVARLAAKKYCDFKNEPLRFAVELCVSEKVLGLLSKSLRLFDIYGNFIHQENAEHTKLFFGRYHTYVGEVETVKLIEQMFSGLLEALLKVATDYTYGVQESQSSQSITEQFISNHFNINYTLPSSLVRLNLRGVAPEIFIGWSVCNRKTIPLYYIVPGDYKSVTAQVRLSESIFVEKSGEYWKSALIGAFWKAYEKAGLPYNIKDINDVEVIKSVIKKSKAQ